MENTVKKSKNDFSLMADEYSKVAGEEVKETQKEVFSNALIVKISTIKVTSQDTLKDALELLSALKIYLADKETRRKSIVDPINKSVKLINQDYKKITDKVNEAIETVTAQIMKYRQAEAKRIAEANAKEEARIAKEKADAEAKLNKELEGTRGEERQDLLFKKEEALQAIDEGAKIRTQVKTVADSGITFRKVWTYELIDLAKVPRQFLKLDESAVLKSVRAGAREIPGIKIFEKETTALNL